MITQQGTISKVKISNIEIAVSRIENYPRRPTIIFLHDSLGCIRLWKYFPQQLGELTKCNVFIYDRQGYGEAGYFTMAERKNDYMEIEAGILAKIIDQYKLNDVILFGHSDGGTIALIAAAKYPERIKAIVTEGAHIFVEEETIHGIEDVINAYNTTDLKVKLAKYHADKTEEMFWAWAKTWTTDQYRSWNITNLLPAVKCPALIIQGEQDEYGTIRQVDEIVNHISGTATKMFLPEMKHTPHKESPELILKITSVFISDLVNG